MDTKSIRYFCRVYEEKSIHQAARLLFITPQGLSRIIRHLEEELGTALFERSSKGMLPTEAGDYLYSNSRELFDLLEELEVGIQRFKDEKQKYGIGFACGVLNIFPFQKMSELTSLYPAVKIHWEEANTAEIIKKIKQGSLSLGFVIGDQCPAHMEMEEIFSIKPDVIVYKGHPFYEREGISVGELKEEKLITLNEKFYSYHSMIARCQDYGFVPDIIAKTMESQLIYRFVKEHHGIGVDVNIHHDDMKMGELKRVPLTDAFPWKINAVYRKEEGEDQLIRDIIGYFRNSITK